MHERHSFEYAILRIVPSVERGEFVNAGVVLFCKGKKFLDARVHLDEARLRVLWPDLDIAFVRQHLEAFPKLCVGGADAGPIARLSDRERFRWLVAPRSTVIQVSAVHSGLCTSPEQTLEDLFMRLVSPPGSYLGNRTTRKPTL